VSFSEIIGLIGFELRLWVGAKASDYGLRVRRVISFPRILCLLRRNPNLMGPGKPAICFSAGHRPQMKASDLYLLPAAFVAVFVGQFFNARLGDALHRLFFRGAAGWEDVGRIERPPAYRISRFLGLLFGRRAFERLFGQIVADANEDWIEATAARNRAELALAAVGSVVLWVARRVDAARKISKNVRGE